MKRLKVLAYPKDSNPYQTLLYDSMPEVQVAFARRGKRSMGKGLFPFVAAWYRLSGYRILHIHWPEFDLPRKLPMHRQLSSLWFVACVRAIKLLRFRIVWTVHNVVPHEQVTADDEGAARFLAAQADAKIVHASDTLLQMQARGMDVGRTSVIPHGNYDGVYPDEITRSEARRKLGFGPDEVVALFFGNIRRYKGIDHLVSAFAQLPEPNARLMIVGRPLQAEPLDVASMTADARVHVFAGWVDDEDVATYFRACDFVCWPFQALTTSGSVLLALTFGVPVVAPRIGSLVDLPADVGWLYDPKHPDALRASIEQAICDAGGRRDRAAAARRCADSVSWDRIGRQVLELYEQVITPVEAPS